MSTPELSCLGPTASNEFHCREWWKIETVCIGSNDDFFTKNLYTHLQLTKATQDLLILVTRPEWIHLQLKKDRILQYDRDISFPRDQICYLKDDSQEVQLEWNVRDIDMNHDAVRFSMSYMIKNPL